jgi:transcriptional regulator GlxA family with amidase domain
MKKQTFPAHLNASADKPDSSDTESAFLFLLVDGLSMMSLSSAVEPLRSANRLMNKTLYSWTLASLDGKPVHASNGIELQAQKLDDVMARAQYIFVCGGLRLDPTLEPEYLRALRRAARTGAVIGSLSTGSYLLARAGLLEGYQCTIHWENLSAFTEEFRGLMCSGKIYEIDRDRMTCSGGIAAMDMMLQLISEQHGPELAVMVELVGPTSSTMNAFATATTNNAVGATRITKACRAAFGARLN